MSRTKGIGIGLALLLVAVVLGGNFLVNRMVRERFDQELARFKNRLDVHYETVRFELWSGKIRAGQVSATTSDGQLKLLADSVLVRDWKRNSGTGVVTRMGISAKDLRVHRRGEKGGWIPKFNGYGYDDPKLGLELDYQYEPETRALVLDRFKLGGTDLGALSLQGRMTDVASVDWSRLGEGLLLQRLAALGSLKIAGLQMEYNDFGFLPRVFAQQASASGKTPDDVANQVYAVIESQKSLRLSASMLESIRKFLNKPDRIELVMQPAKPFGTTEWSLAVLLGGDLVKLLGVDIRT